MAVGWRWWWARRGEIMEPEPTDAAAANEAGRQALGWRLKRGDMKSEGCVLKIEEQRLGLSLRE